MAEKKTTLKLKAKRKPKDASSTKLGAKRRIIVNMATSTPKQQKKAKKAVKKPSQPKITKIPPSLVKLREFDALLHERFDSWRTYQPLKLRIESDLFKLISSEQLSVSKRVVRKLLYRHTRNSDYLKNVVNMRVRVALDNTIHGEILDSEKDYAREVLAK